MVQCWWCTEATLLYRIPVMSIGAVTRLTNTISHIIDTMTQASNCLGLSAVQRLTCIILVPKYKMQMARLPIALAFSCVALRYRMRDFHNV